MCRHLAYVGPPSTLGQLVFDPPYSLERQAFEPREQTRGKVNVDGFGVGWYAREHRREPALYRSVRPIWNDASFRSISGVIASGCVVASVRSATPPSPVEATSAQPFARDRYLFCHNGAVDDFRAKARMALLREVSDRRAAEIETASDSELLFAVALDALDGGATPPQALRDVIKRVDAISGGDLNLVLADGEGIAATACGPTLYVRETDAAVVVASEPSDEGGGWKRIPDRSVVEVTPGGVEVSEA